MHTSAKRRTMHQSSRAQDTASRSGAVLHAGIPNSAMLSMRGGDNPSASSISDLGERIRSRQPNVRERVQAQIPQAENEADRLSVSVTGGSPESVKAAMGHRMGADFSGVRFHTGADAVARANAMGARAYTSGADVYFGAGGFDPSIAAHELVHAVQQGMVDSSAATMSTPAGGVQRKGFFKFFARKLNVAGYFTRKRHDELDELYQARKNGDWYDLSEEQQEKWINDHQGAYEEYMEKRKDPKFKKELKERRAKRDDELAKAEEFLAKHKMEKRTLMLGDPKHEELNPAKEKGFFDTTTGQIVATGGKMALEEGGIKVAERVIGSEAVGPLAGIVENIISIAQSIYQLDDAGARSSAMEELLEEFEGVDDSELSDNELVLKQSMMQALRKGDMDQFSAIMDIISNTIGAGANLAELAGHEEAALLMKGASLGADAVKSVGTMWMKEKNKREVVEESTGITEELIEEFMEKYKIDNYHRAKQALVKAKGYASGKREELFADQTRKRVEAVGNMADQGNKVAIGAAKGMGAYNEKTQQADQGKMFNAMGGEKTREEVAMEYNNSIAIMAAARRREKEAAKKKKL